MLADYRLRIAAASIAASGLAAVLVLARTRSTRRPFEELFSAQHPC